MTKKTVEWVLKDYYFIIKLFDWEKDNNYFDEQ